MAIRPFAEDVLVGIVPRDQAKEPAGEMTMHSGNIDTLAFQAALIGLVYVLTYGFVTVLGQPSAGRTRARSSGAFSSFSEWGSACSSSGSWAASGSIT